MHIPEHIGANCINAHGLCHLHALPPGFCWHTGVMHLARDYLKGLSIQQKSTIPKAERMRCMLGK